MPYDADELIAECNKRLKTNVGTIHTGTVDIEEKSDDGAGIISFDGIAKCLLLVPSHAHVRWNSTDKCADGAIIDFRPDGVRLHVVELKSKLTMKKWISAKEQLEGMFVNATAICGALGATNITESLLYIAYREEVISEFLKRNPIAQKHAVGTNKPLSAALEWKAGKVSLFGKLRLRLVAIIRDENGNGVANVTPLSA